MSTLQSLLSKINVQQVGGAGLAYPIDLNEGRCHIKWDTSSDTKMDKADLARAALDNKTPAISDFGIPSNMDAIMQDISKFEPTSVYTSLRRAGIVTAQGAQHTPNNVVAATKLVNDPNNPKKLAVEYVSGNTIVNPETGLDTYLHNGQMNQPGAFFRATYLACLAHYVVDNTMINNSGELENIGATQPAGVGSYAFLAQGGVGAYATHLPNSTVVDGLPGAMALAAFQPVSFNPIIGAINREGNVGQTGGGAFVLSSAPSVRKYCADSNYLVQEIKRQKALMTQKGLTLTANSNAKVDNLLAKLQRSEAELCKTYELLDNLVGAKEDGKDLLVTDAKGKTHEFKNPIDINDVQQAQSQLQALKKKLSVKALSTVLTLSQIVQDAVVAVGKQMQQQQGVAKVNGQFNNQQGKMGGRLPPVAQR